MGISMRWLLVVGLCGCDAVFGLSGDPRPCDTSSFDQVTPSDIAPAEQFSISWDRSLAVVQSGGLMFEMNLPSTDMKPIDLGIYVDVQLSLNPEGDALLYTAEIEPPVLQGALRIGDAQWSTGAQVPLGTFAGTPSADAFGPRHVLVI